MPRQMPEAGHRVVPTVPLTIEGWGPTRADALTQLVVCLAESVAVPAEAAEREADAEPVAVRIDRGTDTEMLTGLLGEILGLGETLGLVPVGGVVEELEDSGLLAYVDVVPSEPGDGPSPVPTAVDPDEVFIGDDGERWWCRARLVTT